MRSSVIQREHGLGAVALDDGPDAITNGVQRLIPAGPLELGFPLFSRHTVNKVADRIPRQLVDCVEIYYAGSSTLPGTSCSLIISILHAFLTLFVGPKKSPGHPPHYRGFVH